jgi:hypothetical protein
MENDWKKPDGTPAANRDMWEGLVSAVEDLKASDCNITWEYVRGHNGDPGNEQADKNASRGVVLSQKKIYDNITITTDAKSYGKVKPVKYNRMLNQKLIYLPTPSEGLRKSPDGRCVYYCGSHGKVDELIGVRSIDAKHSVVFLKEPDEVVENIKRFQAENYKGPVELPVILKMDSISTPKVYREIQTNSTKYLTLNSKGGIRTIEKVKLTEPLTKPLLVHRLIDVLSTLEGVLERYVTGALEKEPFYKVIDITDELFTLSDAKKPKTILRKEITSSTKLLTVTAVHMCKSDPSEDKLVLTFGADLAARNTLNALACEGIKVKLITWPESFSGYRYATVVETPDDVGIWAAGHSNLKLIE